MVQNWISIKICHDLDLWPNNLVQDKCTPFIQMHSFRWSISQIESREKKNNKHNYGLDNDFKHRTACTLTFDQETSKLVHKSPHILCTQKHFVSEVCEPDLGKEKEYLFQTIDVRQMDEWTAEQTDHYRVQK